MKFVLIAFIVIIAITTAAYSMSRLKKEKLKNDSKENELEIIKVLIEKINKNIYTSEITCLADYLDELYKDKLNFVVDMIKKSNIIDTWKNVIKIDKGKAYLNYYNPEEGYNYQINLYKIEETWKIENIQILR